MLAAGTKAPDIAFGGESLYRLLGSGRVLIAFFKVSCPTCQLTFPFLQRFKDDGTAVIGVSQDSAAATEAFRERLGLTFPLWLDSAPAGYVASNAYRISYVPSLFLIEGDGTIARVSEGFVKQDLETMAETVGVTLFAESDSVPAFRPG